MLYHLMRTQFRNTYHKAAAVVFSAGDRPLKASIFPLQGSPRDYDLCDRSQAGDLTNASEGTASAISTETRSFPHCFKPNREGHLDQRFEVVSVSLDQTFCSHNVWNCYLAESGSGREKGIKILLAVEGMGETNLASELELHASGCCTKR